MPTKILIEKVGNDPETGWAAFKISLIDTKECTTISDSVPLPFSQVIIETIRIIEKGQVTE